MESCFAPPSGSRGAVIINLVPVVFVEHSAFNISLERQTFPPLLLTISPLFVYIRNTVYRCVYSGGLQQEVYILRVLFLMIYQYFVNHFQASAAVDSHCEPLSSLLACSCICVFAIPNILI